MASTSRSADHPTGDLSCLVVIYGNDIGRTFDLATGSIVIGRSSKAGIQVDQESISRHHAKVVNTGKVTTIYNLSSTNGTDVNDEPIDQHVLRDGDLIKVGRTIFKFLAAGNVERAYHEKMYQAATLAQQGGTFPSGAESSRTVTIPDAANATGGRRLRKR